MCINGSLTVPPFSIFAPAKLNLFLAVTGRRADGFHDLVSVVAPVSFGDTLRAEPAETFSLVCNDPDVPCDASNLVLKAAAAFEKAIMFEPSAPRYIGLSKARRQLHDLRRVVRALEQAAKLEASARILGLLQEAYSANNQPLEAARMGEQVAKLAPQNAKPIDGPSNVASSSG